jgi:hypothetical protein
MTGGIHPDHRRLFSGRSKDIGVEQEGWHGVVSPDFFLQYEMYKVRVKEIL